MLRGQTGNKRAIGSIDPPELLLFLQSREISGFRYFVKMVCNCMIEELNYDAVHNVSIAHDD